MTKKKKINWKKFRGGLPYLIVGILTLTLVFVGSLDKRNSDGKLSLGSFAAENYKNVSVDQLSELYTVADLSHALSLASAQDVAANYVMINAMYDSGQTSTGKLEKPNLTDAGNREWVIEYVVEEGEDMDSIAAKFGISTDQIRWSNGLKTKTISAGDTLYLPKESGIVYTAKAGDTIESIASRYGSNIEEITIFNDLDVSGLSEGMRVFIKDGTLPETERPEYVAPVVRSTYATTNYTYTYLGNASSRTNLVCNRSLGAGQCTSWGWLKRPDLGFIKANASGWDDIARSAGLRVDRTPAAGAIFQTDSGWYGHVGYVESVNSDGSINVSERNYAGCYGVLFSTIPASEVGKFNYIH